MKYFLSILLPAVCLSGCKLLTEFGGGYTKEEGKVYWNHGLGGSNNQLVKDADYRTFESLNTNYGKDKRNVFYRTNIISNADLKSFEVFNHTEYAKDKNAVYFSGDPVPGADVSSYRLFDVVGVDNSHYNTYGIDKNHVYSFTEIISDDPDHFKVINPNETIWKDNFTVHRGNGIIPGTHAPTFEAILFKERSQEFSRYSSYYKDKNNVFVEVKDKGVIADIIPLDGADVNSFRLISENFSQPEYAADKNRVYYEHKVVEGADPDTFVLLPDGKAADKQHTYQFGKKINE